MTCIPHLNEPDTITLMGPVPLVKTTRDRLHYYSTGGHILRVSSELIRYGPTYRSCFKHNGFTKQKQILVPDGRVLNRTHTGSRALN